MQIPSVVLKNDFVPYNPVQSLCESIQVMPLCITLDYNIMAMVLRSIGEWHIPELGAKMKNFLFKMKNRKYCTIF